MNIAIDFDGTWTLDPWFWAFFAGACENDLHKLYIITRREPINDPRDLMSFRNKHNIPYSVEIYFASGQFKRHYAESIGLKIDVWIDDEPGTVEPQRLLETPPDKDL